MSTLRTRSFPRLATLATLAALAALAAALVAGPAGAASAQPVEAHGKTTASAPFTLDVTRAELASQPDGSERLELDYLITNTSEETVAGVAWGLEVQNTAGEPTAGEVVGFQLVLEPGEQVARSHTFGSEISAAIEPQNLLVLIAAGSSTSSGGICPGGGAKSEQEACDNWQFVCDQMCNGNHLFVGPGIQSSSCGPCSWAHDAQRNCYYLSCQATCVCNPSDWPPHLPAGPGPWAEDRGELPMEGPLAEPVGDDGHLVWN